MSKRKSIATAAVVSPPKRTRRESTRRASTNSKRADDEFVELIDTSVRAQKMRAAEWAKEQKLAKAATPAPKAAKVKAPAARSRKSVAKIESGNESSDDEAPVKKLTVAQQRAKAAAWYKEQLESPVKTPTKPQVTATPTIVKSPVASAKKRVAASRNMKSTIEESESEDNASKDGVVDIAPAIATPTPSATITDASKALHSEDEDELVNLWDHFWSAFGCSVRAIIPWLIALTCVFYVGAMSQGWNEGNEYAKWAVIVGITYAAILLVYFVVLLPLIVVSRTVDKALYSNGGTILTSSIFEISILAMFVISSLVITSYLTTDAKA